VEIQTFFGQNIKFFVHAHSGHPKPQICCTNLVFLQNISKTHQCKSNAFFGECSAFSGFEPHYSAIHDTQETYSPTQKRPISPHKRNLLAHTKPVLTHTVVLLAIHSCVYVCVCLSMTTQKRQISPRKRDLLAHTKEIY